MKRVAAICAVVAGGLLWGCDTAEDVFVDGRLRDLCNGAIPVCNVQASCILTDRRYLRSSFPGSQQILVRSEEPDRTLVARLFFSDMVFPGTELVLQAHSPQCSSFAEEQLEDIDIFEAAGDDRVLQFSLDLPDKGDHLFEVFSDMTATYLLTIDVE